MSIDYGEKGRERDRERHQCERETSISHLPHAPLMRGSDPQPRNVPCLGIESATFLVYGTMLQATEPPMQGYFFFLYI